MRCNALIAAPANFNMATKLHLIAFGCSEKDTRAQGNRHDIHKRIERLGKEIIQIDFGVYLFRPVESSAAIREVENALSALEAEYLSVEIGDSLKGLVLNEESASRLEGWGVSFQNLKRPTR